MKRIHKTFGEVTVSAERLTSGGNRVVDETDKDGRQRVLLTDPKYWEEL
jgi:hypothetical protein